jgi:hypothetical protein
MRLTTLMALLVLTTLAAGQPNECESLYVRFEQKIKGAKAYKLTFTWEEMKTGRNLMRRKGELIVAAGNKFKLTVQGKERRDPFTAVFICDGKHFWSKSFIRDEMTIVTRAALEGHAAIVTANLCLVGVIRNVDPLAEAMTAKSKPLQNWKLTNFRLIGTEKVENNEAVGIEFDLVTGVPQPLGNLVSRKMWFDIKSAMPVKRISQIKKEDIVLTIVEIYSHWDVDPKLNGNEFTLPK